MFCALVAWLVLAIELLEYAAARHHRLLRHPRSRRPHRRAVEDEEERMTADPIALARDLLRCPSVTPAEGGALAFIERVLKGAGFEVHRVTFEEAGTDPVENLYARIGTARAASDVRRPYRRGAAGRRVALEPSAVRERDRQGRALRPRRGRHERLDRLQDRGGARLSRRAWRQAERLDLVPDHRRRGRHRGQRHRQAAAMGRRARRKIRSLHSGRADQSAKRSAT